MIIMAGSVILVGGSIGMGGLVLYKDSYQTFVGLGMNPKFDVWPQYGTH